MFLSYSPKGSHVIMMNAKNIRIVIPVHPRKDVKLGLIRVIMKDGGLRSFKFLRGK